MKGIIPDFVVGAHGENGLPSRLQRCATGFDVWRTFTSPGGNIRSFVCQKCREFLPHELRDRRFVICKARERRTERSLARRSELAADRIVVMQVERTQKRLECQPL